MFQIPDEKDDMDLTFLEKGFEEPFHMQVMSHLQ